MYKSSVGRTKTSALINIEHESRHYTINYFRKLCVCPSERNPNIAKNSVRE